MQTFVALTQNVLAYTLGTGVAAWAGGGGDGLRGLAKLFRTPALLAIACAPLARWYLHAGGGSCRPSLRRRRGPCPTG